MRLITYRSEVAAAARLGAIIDNQVIDLSKLASDKGQYLPDNMLDFIDLGPQGIKAGNASNLLAF